MPRRTFLATLALALTAAAAAAQDPARPQPGAPSQPAAQPRPGAPTLARQPLMVRLSDITKVQGANANVIHGVGLITGLKGTGDSAKAVRESLVSFLKRSGYNRKLGDIATGNTAMVMVKATIPPFSKKGMLLDVTVSAINDASSLHGGVLEATALRAVGDLSASGKVYGTATGRIFVGGASFGTNKASITRNHPTVGTVFGGCMLSEAPRSFYLNDAGHLELRFLNPSIRSVVTAVNGINELVGKDGFEAEIVDQYMLRIRFPERLRSEPEAVKLLGRIYAVPVATSQRAKVLIDEATGMILAGEGVQISPCAFAVGDVHITVVSEDVVSQPGPGFNRGETAVVNRTRVEVTTQNTNPQAIRGGATVEELVKNLNALNLTPAQLIAVFSKLSKGGFLHAEFEYR